MYRLENGKGRLGGIEYLLGQARQNNNGSIDGPFRRGISRAVQRHTLTLGETDPPGNAARLRAHNDAEQERERRHRIKIGSDTAEDHWLGYIEPDLQLDTPSLMLAAKEVDPKLYPDPELCPYPEYLAPELYIARRDAPHLPKMGDAQKSYLQAIRAKPNLPEREGTHLAILFRHVIDYEDDRRAWATLRHFVEVGGHRWLTDRLVTAHLKMVPPRVFRSRHDDRDRWDDLVGAGNEGLMLAVGCYDHRYGVQFNTYARRSIVSAIKDGERELRSAVHRPSDYWEKREDVAVFDASLDFDGGGRPLSEVYSDGDEALPLRDGGAVKRKVWPLRGRTNHWTLPDKDHLKRMRVWLDALWARPQQHLSLRFSPNGVLYLDKAARLFIDEWRTVYGVLDAMPSHGRVGFEFLCRSRLTSAGSRAWTLWKPKPQTLITSHAGFWRGEFAVSPHFRPRLKSRRRVTSRAVWEYAEAYTDPCRYYTRAELIDAFVASRPDIQEFLALSGFVDEDANREAFLEAYYPRLNSAEDAAEGGMSGFFAGHGGDAHDAAGYSGDFKGHLGYGTKGKKAKAVEEHQETEDGDWERTTPGKAWKVSLRPRLLEDVEMVRKAYKDKRPSKKKRCGKRGKIYLPVVHGEREWITGGVAARNCCGTVTRNCFGQVYFRMAPETVVRVRSAPLPAEAHHHPYSGSMWEMQNADGARPKPKEWWEKDIRPRMSYEDFMKQQTTKEK